MRSHRDEFSMDFNTASRRNAARRARRLLSLAALLSGIVALTGCPSADAPNEGDGGIGEVCDDLLDNDFGRRSPPHRASSTGSSSVCVIPPTLSCPAGR